MANKPPIINTGTVEMMKFGQGDTFHARIGRLAPLLGMEKLGCSLVELEPDKRAWPYHLHYGQEELFVILEGEGSLRYDGETCPLQAGDILFTPPGKGTAHQIINTSRNKLRYLALSSMDDPEVCYYPDSEKYGAYSRGKEAANGVRFLAPKSAQADYWDGEADET